MITRLVNHDQMQFNLPKCRKLACEISLEHFRFVCVCVCVNGRCHPAGGNDNDDYSKCMHWEVWRHLANIIQAHIERSIAIVATVVANATAVAAAAWKCVEFASHVLLCILQMINNACERCCDAFATNQNRFHSIYVHKFNSSDSQNGHKRSQWWQILAYGLYS